MKKLVLLLLLAVIASPLYADVTLWYNGDFDGANGLVNQGSINGSAPAYTYDDFLVSGGSWTLTGAFSNNLMSFNSADSADVEIRSGVSAFNPGTLIYGAYGIGFTQTATGNTGFGLTEYTIAVDLPNIVLGPGTYWLMVAPTSIGVSFVSTTSGANCVGTPCGTGNNSFLDAADFGAFFNPATDYLTPADFSMGVIGTSSAVPEPSSLIMLGSGLLAVAGAARRRLSA